jgi:LysM repeat protein
MIMQRKLLLISALLLSAFYSVNAQEADADEPKSSNLVSHHVEMGETVMLIAKKYRITPTDVYAFNPDAVNGITPSTVLQIPADRKYVPKSKNKKLTEPADDNYGNQTASVTKG